MKDANDTSTPVEAPTGDKTPALSAKGKNAMQGHWTAQDGSGVHAYYEGAVEDALDETATRDGVVREVSSELPLPNGQKVDTFIQKGQRGLVIDYKTNDMTNWSNADAVRCASEHGSQVQGYLPQVSDDKNIPAQNLAGYVVFTGASPQKSGVFDTYKETLQKFDIGLATPKDGDAPAVVATVKQLAKKQGV